MSVTHGRALQFPHALCAAKGEGPWAKGAYTWSDPQHRVKTAVGVGTEGGWRQQTAMRTEPWVPNTRGQGEEGLAESTGDGEL